MRVLEAFNRNFDHYSGKLPRWANAILWIWIVLGAVVYFGILGLPEIGWWRFVIMAPVGLFVLAVMLQAIAYFFGWIFAPFRWLLQRSGTR